MNSDKSSNKQEISITVSTQTILRIIGFTIATVVLVFAVQKASHSLMLVFSAFFLALALNAPVSWISRHLPAKRKGSRSLATAISFVMVLLVLGAFMASLIPPLVKQTSNFLKATPDIVRDLRSQDSSTGRFIRQYNLESQVDKMSNELSERIGSISGKTFDTLKTVSSSVVSVLTILVLTFMMLIEGPKWRQLALSSFAKGSKRDLAERIANDSYKVVKGFVNGQVTLAAIASVLILPALLMLGIDYPIALMGIVFICGLIPLVGHTIGALIVSAVALFQSPTAALIILAYYILYQQIENYFVQPKIQANATNMSPLLVFASVIIGVSFGGLAAGLFAIPIAGVIRIVALEYLRHHGLIDQKTFNEVTSGNAK